MDGIPNAMRREAARVMAQLALTRVGIVSAYDPDTYSAKVFIQPENTETGWLPISSPWVGNGWGMFAAPGIGDVVEVRFQEGGKQAGMIGLRHFGNVLKPLSVPSKEFWLQHESGSFLKLTNDGSVEIHAAKDLIATVAGKANIDVAGDVNASVGGQANLAVTGKVIASAEEFRLTGNVHVTGDMHVTGEIYDLDGLHGSFGYLRQTYNIHVHPTSGGNTGLPNPLV